MLFSCFMYEILGAQSWEIDWTLLCVISCCNGPSIHLHHFTFCAWPQRLNIWYPHNAGGKIIFYIILSHTYYVIVTWYSQCSHSQKLEYNLSIKRRVHFSRPLIPWLNWVDGVFMGLQKFVNCVTHENPPFSKRAIIMVFYWYHVVHLNLHVDYPFMFFFLLNVSLSSITHDSKVYFYSIIYISTKWSPISTSMINDY